MRSIPPLTRQRTARPKPLSPTAEADLGTAQADLVTAEANLPALRSRAERYQTLLAIHAVGDQDYDDASAAVRQAEASLESRKTMVGSRKASIEANRAVLESARINLSYTPIKRQFPDALESPISPSAPWRPLINRLLSQSSSNSIPFMWMWCRLTPICCVCGTTWQAAV